MMKKLVMARSMVLKLSRQLWTEVTNIRSCKSSMTNYIIIIILLQMFYLILFLNIKWNIHITSKKIKCRLQDNKLNIELE